MRRSIKVRVSSFSTQQKSAAHINPEREAEKLIVLPEGSEPETITKQSVEVKPIDKQGKGTIIGLKKEKEALKGALKTGLNVLLIGETGTCKTSVVKALADEMEQELVRINLDGGTSTDQLVGRFQVRKHSESDVPETYFQEGALVRAMRQGNILLLDEINAALADVLFVLHAVLEKDSRLFIPETGEEVIPHENFRVVATMNPVGDYAGTRTLNHALYSRFGCVIRFKTPSGADVLSIMKNKYPTHSEGSLIEITETYEEMQRLAQQEKINTRISVRECIAACEMASVLPVGQAINWAMVEKLEPEERKEYRGSRRTPETSMSIVDLLTAHDINKELRVKVSQLEKELSGFENIKKMAQAFIDSGAMSK